MSWLVRQEVCRRFEFARHFESYLALRMRTMTSDEHSIVPMLRSTRFIFSTHSLNEQIAYKRAWSKKIYGERNKFLSKWPSSKGVTLVICTQALRQFARFKKKLKTVRCILWLLWCHFCISRIQIDEAIASTACVEAKKEALARQILQVRQLMTPPGTCLIDNATRLNAMCDALLP